MLGLFNLGVLGTLAANIVRLFLGDTYQFGLVIIGALGVALTVTGTWPQLARHYLIGSATAGSCGSVRTILSMLISTGSLWQPSGMRVWQTCGVVD